jgi:hypothetical protein
MFADYKNASSLTLLYFDSASDYDDIICFWFVRHSTKCTLIRGAECWGSDREVPVLCPRPREEYEFGLREPVCRHCV